MAMSLNKVQLIGNLTRDPEMKQLPGGAVVTSFGLATNFSWTNQDGEKQDKTEFHNITAWRKLAEICEEYLRKGSKVYIEGRLQTRDWEAEDGTKRYRTEIVADNMIMLDKKGDAVSGGSYAGAEDRAAGGIDTADEAPAKGKAKAESSDSKKEEVKVDDLPF